MATFFFSPVRVNDYGPSGQETNLQTIYNGHLFWHNCTNGVSKGKQLQHHHHQFNDQHCQCKYNHLHTKHHQRKQKTTPKAETKQQIAVCNGQSRPGCIFWRLLRSANCNTCLFGARHVFFTAEFPHDCRGHIWQQHVFVPSRPICFQRCVFVALVPWRVKDWNFAVLVARRMYDRS